MVHVAIAEDEKEYIDTLVSHIRRYEQEYSVAFDVKVFRSALELVEEYRPVYDILFLDIEMPLLDGISAAKQIRETDTHVMIMFITQMAQYAIQGYTVDAIDYVLKPLTYPAFVMKMKKLLQRIPRNSGRQLILRTQGGMRRICPEDICFIETVSHRLEYHTISGSFPVWSTMQAAEAELSEEGFIRCNSCYLINPAHLDEVQGDIAMVRGHALKISRSRRKAFLDALFRYQRGDRS